MLFCLIAFLYKVQRMIASRSMFSSAFKDLRYVFYFVLYTRGKSLFIEICNVDFILLDNILNLSDKYSRNSGRIWFWNFIFISLRVVKFMRTAHSTKSLFIYYFIVPDENIQYPFKIAKHILFSRRKPWSNEWLTVIIESFLKLVTCNWSSVIC